MENQMAKDQKVASIGHNQAVAKKLYKLLADSYTLLLTTQNLHWNVEGKEFYSIHKLTDDMYNEQFAANDEIAERIRALGQKVDGTYNAFAAVSTVKNKPTLDGLIAAQQEAVQAALETVEAAEEAGDVATSDLATTRIRQHEKNIWMLNAQR
jgi:starvation-inducible DNA-binding protein